MDPSAAPRTSPPPPANGYPSRRLRSTIRTNDPTYRAWERVALHLRDMERRALGSGDMAMAQAFRRLVKVAVNGRDQRLISSAVKRGDL